MSVRKVCDSTDGRPRRVRMPRGMSPRPTAWRTSVGTIGFTQSSSSTPCSNATEACTVRSSTPSTQSEPSTRTGG